MRGGSLAAALHFLDIGYGPSVACTVGCTWLMYSLCMAHIWPMYDLHMAHILAIHGHYANGVNVNPFINLLIWSIISLYHAN